MVFLWQTQRRKRYCAHVGVVLLICFASEVLESSPVIPHSNRSHSSTFGVSMKHTVQRASWPCWRYARCCHCIFLMVLMRYIHSDQGGGVEFQCLELQMGKGGSKSTSGFHLAFALVSVIEALRILPLDALLIWSRLFDGSSIRGIRLVFCGMHAPFDSIWLCKRPCDDKF